MTDSPRMESRRTVDIYVCVYCGHVKDPRDPMRWGGEYQSAKRRTRYCHNYGAHLDGSAAKMVLRHAVLEDDDE